VCVHTAGSRQGQPAAGHTRRVVASGEDRQTVADSSAGGLAMSTLLALRDGGTELPGAAALLCPWVDLAGRTHRPPQESPIVFLPEMAEVFADAYLDGHPADGPLVDPLRADLTGLPTLLIQAASSDVVFQEEVLLAQRAESFGVRVTTSIFPVPTHDFHIFWNFLPEAAPHLTRTRCTTITASRMPPVPANATWFRHGE
jgi:acetyl esterase/lipase